MVQTIVFLLFRYKRVRLENQIKLFEIIRINRKLTCEETAIIQELEELPELPQNINDE